MNAGDAMLSCANQPYSCGATSAESAMVLDGCASECAVYPVDIQFEQENRQAGEHVGRPCEGYTCDGATEKLAESAQVMEVHASASGEGSPGAQMCVTANSEFSKASAMSMCLNQGEIPNDQVTAPVEIREDMIDPCLNQQTASATVADVAHTVPPNPSIHNTVVRYTARSHESTRKRKAVEM